MCATSLLLTWSVPAAGGPAVTGYAVRWRPISDAGVPMDKVRCARPRAARRPPCVPVVAAHGPRCLRLAGTARKRLTPHTRPPGGRARQPSQSERAACEGPSYRIGGLAPDQLYRVDVAVVRGAASSGQDGAMGAWSRPLLVRTGLPGARAACAAPPQQAGQPGDAPASGRDAAAATAPRPPVRVPRATAEAGGARSDEY